MAWTRGAQVSESQAVLALVRGRGDGIGALAGTGEPRTAASRAAIAACTRALTSAIMACTNGGSSHVTVGQFSIIPRSVDGN